MGHQPSLQSGEAGRDSRIGVVQRNQSNGLRTQAGNEPWMIDDIVQAEASAPAFGGWAIAFARLMGPGSAL
jgi:hypothetical protein